MTTLAQGDLSKDPNVLRALASKNNGNFGVYADIQTGRLNVGMRWWGELGSGTCSKTTEGTRNGVDNCADCIDSSNS